jgi:hypothetical protein
LTRLAAAALQAGPQRRLRRASTWRPPGGLIWYEDHRSVHSQASPALDRALIGDTFLVHLALTYERMRMKTPGTAACRPAWITAHRGQSLTQSAGGLGELLPGAGEHDGQGNPGEARKGTERSTRPAWAQNSPCHRPKLPCRRTRARCTGRVGHQTGSETRSVASSRCRRAGHEPTIGRVSLLHPADALAMAEARTVAPALAICCALRRDSTSS